MSGNDRQARFGKVAVDDVQIGPANAAGMDLDQDLVGCRGRQLPDYQFEELSGRVQNHRTGFCDLDHGEIFPGLV